MRLDKTLASIKDEKTPVWFMRQAGRYLPEYRALRATTPDFITYCLDSEKAAAATLQPITRYGFDAAIIFSDILMIPWAMKRGVHFIEGEGPRLAPMQSPDEIATPLDHDTILAALTPVFKAVSLTRAQLPPETNLIGFCGAPWTVATYMIDGGRRDFAKPLAWLRDSPAGMEKLLHLLTEISIDYLAAKAAAGADTLMIFDSWAGAVPPCSFADTIVAPTTRIIAGLRTRGITAPVIGFPRGASPDNLIAYAHKTGIAAISLDTETDPHWAARHIPPHIAIQGNLDPALLLAGGTPMLAAADNILDAFAQRAHIFNLGHGIDKMTPPENVQTLLAHIRKRQ